MRLGELVGHPNDETPDVVGRMARWIAIQRRLAFAIVALAMREAVVRHDRDDRHVIVIKHQPGIGHHFIEKTRRRQAGIGGRAFGVPFSVRQHHVVFGMAGALIRMFREVALAMMQDAILGVGADAQIPEPIVDDLRTDQRAAHGTNFELGSHRPIHLGKLNALQLRQDLPQRSRHVPAYPEIAQKSVNRIQ